MKTHFPRTCASFVSLAALLSLPPLLSAPARAQTTPEMTFRPSLIERTAFSYSYSGKAGSRNDAISGGSSVQHFDTSTNTPRVLGKGTYESDGLAFSMNWIGSDASVPAPIHLGELSMNFGVISKLSQEWTLMAFARPGYYADFSHFTWATINVPVMAAASYSPNQQCTWMFGASCNPFSRYVVMPVLAFRWKFADAWTLNLGFPRFGVAWQVSDKVELSVHATGQGGAFRTTKAPNNRPDLANTYVDYRELRIGVRMTFKDTENKINTALEAGCMARRDFNYYNRNFTLRESPTFYVTFAAGGNRETR